MKSIHGDNYETNPKNKQVRPSRYFSNDLYAYRENKIERVDAAGNGSDGLFGNEKRDAAKKSGERGELSLSQYTCIGS